MSALVEYKCEVCSGTLVNLDADCPQCTNNEEFVDLTSAQFIQRFEKEPLPRAFLALARGAIAGEDFIAQGNAGPVLVTSSDQSLEQDGCDFIRATFLILEHLECPPAVRDFILCLSGLTGGDGNKWFKVTDQQLAEHMGFSPGHIGVKRRDLIAWEQRRNMAVIEIKKGDLDRSTMRYGITEYRVPIVNVAALFIRRVRSLPTKHATSPRALKDEVARGYKEIALELCEEELNEAPIKKDRRKPKTRAVGSSLDRLTERRQKILRLVAECCEAAGLMGYNVETFWNEIDGEVRGLIAGQSDED